MGLFCTVLGAVMLVIPHQFNAPVYLLLQPRLMWWGVLFLLIGMALIGVVTLAPARPILIAMHLVAGAALLTVAYGFATTAMSARPRAIALQMTHSAQHDFLTGLPNRMLLNDRISHAIALASRHMNKVAVLFLDLDGFKHINDSLGHPTGDKLLQSIAKRLADCIRGADTISRQGGDEFVVLLSAVEQSEDAAITARRMLRAVADAHSIDRHELHVTTSIGVSVYPDDGLDAETLIKNADTATGLDPRSLELELTESVLMKGAESTASILKALRARGVQLAVDDFGTGYSSLSYLRKFPIDALKIDQSFVREITTAPDETGIVSAVISMGRSLKLRVVAEGVEKPEDLAFLQAHQCDEAQGYYFSRPVLPQRFAGLLRTGIPEPSVAVH
jgi:diguanylate cyclase (GGDEF)-like protein